MSMAELKECVQRATQSTVKVRKAIDALSVFNHVWVSRELSPEEIVNYKATRATMVDAVIEGLNESIHILTDTIALADATKTPGADDLRAKRDASTEVRTTIQETKEYPIPYTPTDDYHPSKEGSIWCTVNDVSIAMHTPWTRQ